MSMCGYEQSTTAGYEGMDSVVRPKPRRFSLLNPSFNDNIRPFRYFKGIMMLSNKQLASSPHFFCRSPSSRALNPVIQDGHFGNSGTMASFLPAQPMLSSRNGGCVRMKSRDKPVAVLIERFDCLSRDRKNCSISAIASFLFFGGAAFHFLAFFICCCNVSVIEDACHNG